GSATSSRPDTVPTPELVAAAALLAAGAIGTLMPRQIGSSTTSAELGPVLELVSSEVLADDPKMSTTGGAACVIGSPVLRGGGKSEFDAGIAAPLFPSWATDEGGGGSGCASCTAPVEITIGPAESPRCVGIRVAGDRVFSPAAGCRASAMISSLAKSSSSV